MPAIARSNGDSTPQKRRLRSDAAAARESPISTPVNWKSPRRCITASPNSPSNVISTITSIIYNNSLTHFQIYLSLNKTCVNGSKLSYNKIINFVNYLQGTERDSSENPKKSPVKKLSDRFISKPKWNPRGKCRFEHLFILLFRSRFVVVLIIIVVIDADAEQMRAVKEALHVSTAPSTIVCREEEQRRVLEFCKACVEQEKAGSLYVCGCPGTGKSLSMEKVNQLLVDWAKEVESLFPPICCFEIGAVLAFGS